MLTSNKYKERRLSEICALSSSIFQLEISYGFVTQELLMSPTIESVFRSNHNRHAPTREVAEEIDIHKRANI